MKKYRKEDKSSSMRNLARRYGTEIDFHVANISGLPFKTEMFDRVVCISVLEHMSPGEDELAIQEMSRVLKPGGKLLVTVDFSLKASKGKSYSEEKIHKLVELSGLKMTGDYDYRVEDWGSYINDLKQCFNKPRAKITSAAFALVKEE